MIDETLRLGGIAIWLMREAKEDVKYQGTSNYLFDIQVITPKAQNSKQSKLSSYVYQTCNY